MTDKTIIEELKKKLLPLIKDNLRYFEDHCIKGSAYGYDFEQTLGNIYIWIEAYLLEQLTLAEARGRKEAIAEAHQRDLEIETEHKSWIVEHDKQIEKQTANDICKLIDNIESKEYPNSSIDIWKLFKAIRNAIRDTYDPKGFQEDKI